MDGKSQRCFAVLDAQGGVIFSTLRESCAGCNEVLKNSAPHSPCALPGKRRRGRAQSDKGSVFLCTGEKDFVASSKLFKKEIEFYLTIVERIGEMRSEIAREEVHKTRRILHNLISLNAHSLQDLYSVISQDDLIHLKGGRGQKAAIAGRLKSNPLEAADIFLRALKNAGAVKTELAVFRKLYEPSPKLDFARHVVHRVVLNVANYFFQDFADIPLQLTLDSSVAKLRFDYESVQVAIYHLIENAVKYALPGSELRVSFEEGAPFVVRFKMISLYVDEEEREKILLDNQSGRQPKELGKAGQGLGLGMVADLMRLNGGCLKIEWGEPLPLALGMSAESPRYARNSFALCFEKQRS